MIRIAACVVVFVGALSCSIQSLAFEKDGFKSGDTIQTVSQVANSRAIKLQTNNTNAIGAKNYLNYQMYQNGQFIGFLQFCNGRLYLYSLLQAGGFEALASQTEKFIAAYGQPSVFAKIEFNSDGRVSSLNLTWSLPSGENVSASFGMLNGMLGEASVAWSAQQQICSQ